MKKYREPFFGYAVIFSAVLFLLAGCGDNDPVDPDNGNGDTDDTIVVTFSDLSADGSYAETTTELRLGFDRAISGLSVSDITLSGVPGVVKGTLSRDPSGSRYTLGIYNFTSSGRLSVAVAKAGYTVRWSPSIVNIYYYEGVGGGDQALIAKWWGTQEYANMPPSGIPGIASYEFKSNGEYLFMTIGGLFRATGNTITVMDSYSNTIGTANYVINGTKLTLSNVTGSNIFAGEYYKKEE
jgi:hypothetical protein